MSDDRLAPNPATSLERPAGPAPRQGPTSPWSSPPSWARSVASALAVVMFLGAALAGCAPPEIEVPGGDPERGVAAIKSEGCDMCHTIPGVAVLEGTGAPSLEKWARQDQIAGRLPNEPEYLIRWMMDPHALEPETAMRPLGMTEQEARDVAAYLYTLH